MKIKKVSAGRKVLFIFFSLLLISPVMYSKEINKDFYQVKVYHLKNNDQVNMTEQFLKDAYLPALHRNGIKNIGVFKPVNNDTAAAKFIYVLIPFSSAEAWKKISEHIEQDDTYKSAAKNFIEAPSTSAAYERVESILLEAFSGQPHLVLPPSKNAERVFELRSYESPTEHLYEKKVAMFNTGGEIQIFNRLVLIRFFMPVLYQVATCQILCTCQSLKALKKEMHNGKFLAMMLNGKIYPQDQRTKTKFLFLILIVY